LVLVAVNHTLLTSGVWWICNVIPCC